jgi:hypothetical protein
MGSASHLLKNRLFKFKELPLMELQIFKECIHINAPKFSGEMVQPLLRQTISMLAAITNIRKPGTYFFELV